MVVAVGRVEAGGAAALSRCRYFHHNSNQYILHIFQSLKIIADICSPLSKFESILNDLLVASNGIAQFVLINMSFKFLSPHTQQLGKKEQ